MLTSESVERSIDLRACLRTRPLFWRVRHNSVDDGYRPHRADPPPHATLGSPRAVRDGLPFCLGKLLDPCLERRIFALGPRELGACRVPLVKAGKRDHGKGQTKQDQNYQSCPKFKHMNL